MSKILNFLKDSKVFFIATIDGDAPKVRPFGLFFEFENKLYFGVGDFKSSYKQLKKIQILKYLQLETILNGLEYQLRLYLIIVQKFWKRLLKLFQV